jgi:hypothetical protein
MSNGAKIIISLGLGIAFGTMPQTRNWNWRLIEFITEVIGGGL